MARIRTIKPSFWEDEKIAKLSMPCRLFYIGTWNLADDLGVIRGNPALLKSAIFPYDDNLRVSEVQRWIDALVNARMLIPISHKHESYYVIRTFRSHQKLDPRYPNYIIQKEVISNILDSYEDTACTQCVPIGDPPRDGDRDRDLYGEIYPPLSPIGDIPPGGSVPENSNTDPTGPKNQNPKKEKSSAKKERKVFVPPSVEEVKQYCKENGYTVNPVKFVSYYTSNGWMVGRNKMKDWKAAVRTWQSKENENGNRQLPASNQIGATKPADNSSGNDAANKRAELDNLENLAEAVLRSTGTPYS